MKRSYDREVYQRLLWSDKLISTVLRSWTGFFSGVQQNICSTVRGTAIPRPRQEWWHQVTEYNKGCSERAYCNSAMRNARTIVAETMLKVWRVGSLWKERGNWYIKVSSFLKILLWKSNLKEKFFNWPNNRKVK